MQCHRFREQVEMIKQQSASLVLFIVLLIALAMTGCSTNKASAQGTSQATPPADKALQSQQQPAMVRNGQPNEMHKRLDALVGQWNVDKAIYVAGGTAEKPITGNGLLCHREWIVETGNRHLRDITQGTIAGNPYYRLGILSYSTMDKRYEWNTVDALNTMMMTYKGAKNSASLHADIVMTGEFTDQGVLGDSFIGKTIGQRTVIKIESPDRHIFELYFTPPGGKERLIDRAIYTRRKS
jgi:hypothetical protein